jgi:hypothetical protein
MLSAEYFVLRRAVVAGLSRRPWPGRWASTGRIGRRTSSPPQFGHTFTSVSSAHTRHHVHSFAQILASNESGSWDAVPAQACAHSNLQPDEERALAEKTASLARSEG